MKESVKSSILKLPHWRLQLQKRHSTLFPSSVLNRYCYKPRLKVVSSSPNCLYGAGFSGGFGRALGLWEDVSWVEARAICLYSWRNLDIAGYCAGCLEWDYDWEGLAQVFARGFFEPRRLLWCRCMDLGLEGIIISEFHCWLCVFLWISFLMLLFSLLSGIIHRGISWYDCNGVYIVVGLFCCHALWLGLLLKILPCSEKFC